MTNTRTMLTWCMRYRIDFEYVDFYVFWRAWCLVFYFSFLWEEFDFLLIAFCHRMLFSFSRHEKKKNNILWQYAVKRKSNYSHIQQKKEIKNQTLSSQTNIEINIFKINSITHTSSHIDMYDFLFLIKSKWICWFLCLFESLMFDFLFLIHDKRNEK